MKTANTLIAIMFTMLLISASKTSVANCVHGPGDRFQFPLAYERIATERDTVPTANQAPAKEKPEDQVIDKTSSLPGTSNSAANKEAIIKTVPRSRRQAKPKLVTPSIDIKPAPVVRPKIIRTLPRL